LIYLKRCLQILDNEELWVEIAESEHDSKVAGHFEQKKTLELISLNFYGPKMEDWIIEYVQTCDTCQRMKSPRYSKFGLLQPLKLWYSPWESTLVDFIVVLPESEGHTNHGSSGLLFKNSSLHALTETASVKDVANAF
jgi:hypothetical protein